MRIVLPFVLLAAVLAVSMMWQRPQPRADLTIAYVSIETLDPQITRASDDVRMAYSMFEGLMTFNADFEVTPGVAESVKVSDDGLTYTFKLRADAKWSDGEPVKASDFRRSWMLGMLPDTAPPYIDFLHYIKGGKAFTDWASERLAEVSKIEDPDEMFADAQKRAAELPDKYKELVGVTTPDERTVIVELERFTPYFAEISATWPLFPLPMHVIDTLTSVDDGTGMVRRDQQWIKPDNTPRTMISNGPYQLTEWKFKQRIRLTANEHYWNAQAVQAKTVELINCTDVKSMYNLYHSGAIDVLLGATPLPYAPELLDAQKAGERNDVHKYNAYGTYYYEFNCREGSRFADARVRRAFTMAVDKAQITEKVTRLRQEPTGAFIPRGGIAGYESPKGLPFDPERARAELKAAGYGPDKPFGEFEFSYNTGSGHDTVAQAVARMWEREFADYGVKVKLDGQEWKVFLEKRSSGNFDMARGGWFGDYMDPTTFLDLFKTGNGHNDGGFSDPKYDGLLEEAEKELDPKKRFAILERAEAYAMDEALPVLPLYYYNLIDLYDPDRVSDVGNHPRNLQLLYQIKVKSQ